MVSKGFDAGKCAGPQRMIRFIVRYGSSMIRFRGFTFVYTIKRASQG